MSVMGMPGATLDASAAAPRSGVQIHVIDRLEDLEALEPAWDDLVRRAAGSPFMLCTYIAETWRSSAGQAWCIVAWRDHELVGALPLLVHRRRGAREATMLCGPRGDLLCDAREPPTTATALMAAVRTLPVDFLPVYGVLANSTFARTLTPGALHPQQERVFALDMPDGWERAYEQLVSARARSEDRRKLRRLRNVGEVRFDIATSGEELQRALTDAFEIYRRRWRDQAGESGGFGSNESSWRAVGQQMGSRGRVQLVTLRIDGRAVAFAYSFLYNGILWGHRLGFDSELDHYSPGWLTIQHAIAAGSDAGARWVDFGLGNEPYKSRLATSSARLLWGTALTVGVRGSIAGHMNEAVFSARQEAKQRSVVLKARDRAFRLRRALAGRGRYEGSPAHP